MKKFIAAILFSVVALTGCNSDDRDLSGTYEATILKKRLDEEKNSYSRIILIKKSDSYQYDYQSLKLFQNEKVFDDAKTLGFLTQKGDYLISEKTNNKIFEITNKGELIFINSSPKEVYIKIN